jgi:hypothetical protein
LLIYSKLLLIVFTKISCIDNAKIAHDTKAAVTQFPVDFTKFGE